MNEPIMPPAIAGLVADLRSPDLATSEGALGRVNALDAAAVPWLLAAVRAEHTIQGRINLGKALAHLGMVAWEPLLAAARDNDDLDFGWSVAWALQKFQAVATVDDFLAALHHPNVHVRWAAALGLGDFSDARAVDPLIAALAEDGPVARRSPYDAAPENYYRKVATCAVKSLRQLGRLALPALLSALHSENHLVRAGVADALTGMGVAEAFLPLVGASRDLDTGVRRRAFRAIAALLPALATEQLIEARDVLLRGLLEPDQYAQTAAMKGLCTLGEQAIAPLVALVRNRQIDSEHRLTRIYAMRAITCLVAKEPSIPGLGQRLLALLAGTLHDQAQPPLLRGEAASALGRTSDALAVEPLIMALSEAHPSIRGAAAEALGQLGDLRALPALNEALHAARTEEDDAEDPDEHTWLLDELEQAIATLGAMLEGDRA